MINLASKSCDSTLFIDIELTFPFASRNASFWRERPKKMKKRSIYESKEKR